MNATGKSSADTAKLALKFGMIAIEKLSMPHGLFDDKIPINKASPSLFLPVIVYKKNDGYEIVDGCKRYKVLKASRKKKIACGTINDEMDSTGAGLLRIGLNANRQLHAREKLLFLGWLKSTFHKKKYLKQSEMLSLPANERHEYEQLLSCKPWLVEAVLQGNLDATVAPEMNHLSETDAGSLVGLFSTLSFSRSMQRELAEWLPEIAFIRKTALPALLKSEPFASIPVDGRLNNPQKAAKILELAHTLRFPLYTETKTRWTEAARRTNPDPSKVTFHATPYFEKNGLEIRIKADRAEVLQRITRQLASIDPAAWQELIDPT
jgi:hypothetical protein